MDVLSFPISFFDRPCDREFFLRVSRLESNKDFSKEKFYLQLFFCWKHFAFGKSPQVKIEEFTDELIENFVTWEGDPGKFVEMALASRFMVKSTSSEGDFYSLADFELVNSSMIMSPARKGGLSRWVKTYQKRSKDAAEDIMELWSRRGDDVAADLGEKVAPEDVSRALLVAHNFAQCANLEMPPEGELRKSYLRDCLEISQAFEDEQLREICLYIMQHRKNSSIVPKHLSLLMKLELIKKFHASLSQSA